MHAARGPEPTILAFTKPAQRSVPLTIHGLSIRIVGPTETAPTEGAYAVAPAENGKGSYFLVPAEPSRL